MKFGILAMATGLTLTGIAGSACADDFISAGDLTILTAPRISTHTGGSTDIHHPDQGKSFDVICTISASGRLSACQAEASNICDTAYVATMVHGFDQMVVATTGRSGQSVIGRKVRLVMKIDYGDGPESL